MNEPTLNTTGTTNLQGSGGVQSGGSGLQQQDKSSNRYQQTSPLQQDALGPEAYRSLELLTVQGDPVQASPSVALGKGNWDVFFAVLLLALLTIAVLLLQRHKKLGDKPVITLTPLNDEQPEVLITASTPKVVKKKKNTPSKIKPKKKSAKKRKR